MEGRAGGMELSEKRVSRARAAQAREVVRESRDRTMQRAHIISEKWGSESSVRLFIENGFVPRFVCGRMPDDCGHT